MLLLLTGYGTAGVIVIIPGPAGRHLEHPAGVDQEHPAGRHVERPAGIDQETPL